MDDQGDARHAEAMLQQYGNILTTVVVIRSPKRAGRRGNDQRTFATLRAALEWANNHRELHFNVNYLIHLSSGEDVWISR
jgi:hypothetical protein